MVYVTRSYRCDKCRKRFQSYREAEDCELDHTLKGIVYEVTEQFRADLQNILNKPKDTQDG